MNDPFAFIIEEGGGGAVSSSQDELLAQSPFLVTTNTSNSTAVLRLAKPPNPNQIPSIPAQNRGQNRKFCPNPGRSRGVQISDYSSPSPSPKRPPVEPKGGEEINDLMDVIRVYPKLRPHKFRDCGGGDEFDLFEVLRAKGIEFAAPTWWPLAGFGIEGEDPIWNCGS